ncbi:MAG TPA: cation-transporting P-type ATPase [Anaerolineales bacterium]|jgi:magnesium-transporting ATPase (P-type)
MTSEPIYSLRLQDVFAALETGPDGLSSSEAEARLTLYGANRLSEQRSDPTWIKLVGYLLHPQAGILFVAAILAFVARDPVLGLVIISLTLANAFFSFWRQYRAEKAIEKLQEILPAYAHILRNGKDEHIPAVETVPGDVLILEEGDNIAADARVVEEYGLRTNNSTLTGESIPARKLADASYQQGISELDQPNLIFAGTSVAAGTGRAVVYSTGMLTQFGRIANLTQSIEPEVSPFQKELKYVTKVITLVAFAIGAVVFAVGYYTDIGLSLEKLFLFTLGIIVAIIPEGLPATLTLSLAAATQRLALKGVLAKKLTIVETLGNVSVICTDKSGTLTQNQMTVRELWVSQQKIKLSGVGYEPKGQFTPSPANQPWQASLTALLEGAACCNNARLNPPTPEHPTWTSLGDQTEAALKVAALKSGIIEKMLETKYPRVHEIPFDARRKRMTTIHRNPTEEVAFVKGAPREVLHLCTKIQIKDEVVDLDNKLRDEIMAANDGYARNALRVLAVARRIIPLKSGPYTAENIEQNLTFLGLIAMMDPPRPEVEDAIRICRQAGIRIVMITGDYGLTAESLARRVGMLTTPNPRIITGAELDEMGELDLQKALEQEVLMARMAPEHKMRLVSAFQARGDVVAVTGDGVNDAPALRKADVGVSMGLVGTDVAKEAADIILTDDNFGAIVAAIEEGRAVYSNVRKFITYIFSSNMPEVMPFVVTASFTQIPLALKVRQILAIDLGTDLFPALALGMEKPEPDVMIHPPRPKGTRLIDNGLLVRSFLWLGMIEVALCYVGFFSVYLFSGNWSLLKLPFGPLLFPGFLALNLAEPQVHNMAVTVFHAGVVFAQMGNAFACRSEKLRNTRIGWFSNRYLLFGILLEFVGIWSIINFDFLAKHFEHVLIPYRYWVGLSFYPLILYGLEWIRKQFARRAKIRTSQASQP